MCKACRVTLLLSCPAPSGQPTIDGEHSTIKATSIVLPRTPAKQFRTLLGLTAAACLALPQTAHAQKPNLPDGLQVTSSTDSSQLLTTILGSGLTQVGTPTLVGQSDAGGAQQGLFTTAGPNILGAGFNSGIVLTTGYASNVVGPNQSESQSKSWTGPDDVIDPGDPDLDKIANGKTQDANALLFNFTVNPGTTQLGFNYVFGSEEYNGFVQNGFNDAFGFFVDGTNVALIPGTKDIVSIDNVNKGQNSAFFRNNDFNEFPNGAPINTELNGLTTVLYADVFGALDPSKSVHSIKLVIADTGDPIYDSAVFIQGNSFSSGTPPIPAIPEAGTATSLGIGLAVLAGITLIARRRVKIHNA